MDLKSCEGSGGCEDWVAFRVSRSLTFSLDL